MFIFVFCIGCVTNLASRNGSWHGSNLNVLWRPALDHCGRGIHIFKDKDGLGIREVNVAILILDSDVLIHHDVCGANIEEGLSDVLMIKWWSV